MLSARALGLSIMSDSVACAHLARYVTCILIRLFLLFGGCLMHLFVAFMLLNGPNRWEAALAVAPAVSFQHWGSLMSRYTEHLSGRTPAVSNAIVKHHSSYAAAAAGHHLGVVPCLLASGPFAHITMVNLISVLVIVCKHHDNFVTLFSL